MTRYIVYHLGKRSKKIRLWWYKRTNGEWMWGMISAIKDLPTPTTVGTVSSVDFGEVWNEVNNKT